MPSPSIDEIDARVCDLEAANKNLHATVDSLHGRLIELIRIMELHHPPMGGDLGHHARDLRRIREGAAAAKL